MADLTPIVVKVKEEKIVLRAEESPIVLKETGQGMPGKDGVTPEFSIGTVRTVEPDQPADVRKSGTREDVILDFDIPKGAPGAWGEIEGDIADQTDLQEALDSKAYITYFVKGTQTAATGNWTGDLPQVEELYEGLAIDYWLPFAGSGNATLTLTLKNGNTDPIPVYYEKNTRVTTTQPVSTIWRYVYQTVVINNVEYTGWWAVRAYDSNTTYNYFSNLVHNRGKFVADSDIYRYNILFHIDDDTLTPLNNANAVTAATKTMLTNVAFDPFAEIFYYGSSGSFSAGGEVAASYLTWNHENVDLRYTLNSGNTLTPDKYIYLKVTMQSDGKCKLAADPCWVQTLPSAADGYHYILLGRAHSNTSISFYHYHPVYYHDGTSLRIMQDPKVAGSGGGGGAGVLYFYQQAVSAATSAEIMRIPASGTRPDITADTVVLSCSFANPSSISGDVSWTSYDGYISFSGTCTAATTANVIVADKSN